MATPTAGIPVSPVFATGDATLDALLSGRKWGGPVGTSADLDVSFAGAGSVFSRSSYGGYGGGNSAGEPFDRDFRGLDAGQQMAFRAALGAWSEVANLRFHEVAETASSVGDIRVAFSGRVGAEGAIAWAYYPVATAIGGDIWLSTTAAALNGAPMVPGSLGYWVLLHEIGHALGLSHSFEGGLATLAGPEDTTQFTVMAYGQYLGAGVSAMTPMLYDIAAIQHLYGANRATRADDDVYRFEAATPYLLAIWDGGGSDTLDASDQTLPATIRLAPGTFSSIGRAAAGGPAIDNVAIAFGVTIEHALGGLAADRLIGNDGANRLGGNDGDDTLTGGGGDDTLEGGNGNDVLAGGDGGDRLVGGLGDDRAIFAHAFAGYRVGLDLGGGIVLRAGDGEDHASGIESFQFADGVFTLASLLAAAEGAPLTAATPPPAADGGAGTTTTPTGPTGDTALAAPPIVGGAGRDALTGGEGDDALLGLAGNDSLIGGAGDDTLDGGVGNDRLWGDQRGGGDAAAVGADRLDGGAGNDWLYGGGGHDTLGGGDGTDRLFGEGGDDVLVGHGGNDALSGGDGDDVLVGGAGNDSLTGGGGADRLVFARGGGADAVLDFARGADRLDVSAFAISAFVQLDRDGDGLLEAGEGDGTLILSARGGALLLDLGDETIAVRGLAALDANDFLFAA